MQVARVAIADEEWGAFRALALSQHVSVSGYLGRLVSAELKRRRAWPPETAQPQGSGLDQALASLAEVRASIDELNDIAGRLARTAVAIGGSWQDVASRLRLEAHVAETAYRRR